MGHTDMIVIADAGLPISSDINRIDISLIRGVPSFIETLNAIKDEIHVESVILAKEIKSSNPEILKFIETIYPPHMITFISHEEFKSLTRDSKAVIRTGECSPYANIILSSGVEF
jgi:D-ribose pyranase